MEIEPLEPLGGSVLLDHSPFVTDMFELDRRWPETSQSHFGPQDPIFEPDEEETVEDEQDEHSWKRVGVSSFTLTDAGGEATSSCARRDSSDETSLDGGKESCGSTELSNGLLSTQIGFTATDGKFRFKLKNLNNKRENLVSSMVRARNNKLQPYAYGNTHGNAAATGTLSLLTPQQTVTLNSHR